MVGTWWLVLGYWLVVGGRWVVGDWLVGGWLVGGWWLVFDGWWAVVGWFVCGAHRRTCGWCHHLHNVTRPPFATETTTTTLSLIHI